MPVIVGPVIFAGASFTVRAAPEGEEKYPIAFAPPTTAPPTATSATIATSAVLDVVMAMIAAPPLSRLVEADAAVAAEDVAAEAADAATCAGALKTAFAT